MSAALRSGVVPAYILLCLVLGGSAQGAVGNAVLQLAGIAIIAWSLLMRPAGPMPRAAKSLLVLAGLVVLLLVLQLIPLPPAIWTLLPGRAFVAEGFALLGQPLPWLPLSLTPYDTLATALTLLAPIAVLYGMLQAGAYRPAWLALAILLGSLAAVLLGALQVGSANPYTSPWYFYERTNHGSATGFFANSNHMAALLVISIPMLSALVRDLRDRAGNPKAKSAALMLAFAGAMVLFVGILLNGSLAVLLLGPLVVAMSGSMLLPERMKLRVPLAVVGILSVLAMLGVYLSPLNDRLAENNSTSFSARQTMWSNTVPAIADQLPLGSGVGSFPELYPRYEDQQAVTRTFANHAHNDYLEIALEAGIPGLILLACFMAWWAIRTRSIWRSRLTDRYAQGATIATAALLLHSIVDFPLRTAALSAIMAACLAIMAQPRSRDEDAPEDLWPTRHESV